jgi:CelD/BcsL family acetyltransferase involved in cellulose biosynthesis
MSGANGGLLQLGLEDPRWANLVARNEDATPFHRASWPSFLSKCYGFRAFVAAVEAPRGALAAAVPLLESRVPLAGRRWIGLPFTDACPPLTTQGEEALPALVEQLAAAARLCGVRRVELRAPILAPGATVTTEAVEHVLALSEDTESIRRGFRPRVRQQISGADRAGVVVRRGERREDLTDVFYRLHVDTRRRLGVPVQRRRFFELLWEHVLAPGGGYVLLAEVGGQAVGAAVFLTDERTTVYKYSASDYRQLKARPNHALLSAAIDDACARGHRRFDFGRSDFESAGLRKFKGSWGAKEIELQYTSIGAPPTRAATGGRLSGIAANVIRRSPLFVCRAAGLFYRFAA